MKLYRNVSRFFTVMLVVLVLGSLGVLVLAINSEASCHNACYADSAVSPTQANHGVIATLLRNNRQYEGPFSQSVTLTQSGYLYINIGNNYNFSGDMSVTVKNSNGKILKTTFIAKGIENNRFRLSDKLGQGEYTVNFDATIQEFYAVLFITQNDIGG